MINIPDNVLEFRKDMREKVGNHKSEMFDVELIYQLDRYEIKSPIEQILYTALMATAEIQNLGDCDVTEIQGQQYIMGLNIVPQFEIGKYRVDFKVSYFEIDSKLKIRTQKEKSVLVECDSQQFHDRTEPERRYEKKRDRDMQKLGFKVFRFTGSEIIKNPLKVAAEIIEYVTEKSKEEILGEMENY